MNRIRETIDYRPTTSKIQFSPPRSQIQPSKLKNNMLNDRQSSLLYSIQMPKIKMGESKMQRSHIDSKKVDEYLENICNFLAKYLPDNKFAKKDLRHPSHSNFNTILLFFLQSIDPSIKEINSSEEIVVEQIQNLGCHLNIHPNLFKSIGLPNNWHQLLAVLDWFCCQLKEFYEIDNFTESLLELEQTTDNVDAVIRQFSDSKFNAVEFMRKKYQPIIHQKTQEQKQLKKQDDEIIEKIQILQQTNYEIEQHKDLLKKRNLQNDEQNNQIKQRKQEVDEKERQLVELEQQLIILRKNEEELKGVIAKFDQIIQNKGISKEENEMITQKNKHLQKINEEKLE